MAMIRRVRFKVLVLLALLVGVSMLAGVFIGVVLASVVTKKKENPAVMRQSLVKLLDKVHPTPEQRHKFEAQTERLIGQIIDIRRQAADAMKTFTTDIDKELTPEQREIFEKIKPREKPEEPKK